MEFEAVVFDLDDTLIIETDTARASMLHVAALIDAAKADHVEDVLFESAREIWRSGPHLPICLELGIASWEGLWSTFEGNDSSLSGLREWAPEYRRAAWRDGLGRLGIVDPPLASRVASAFVEAQRTGHRPVEGAQAAVDALAGGFRLGLLTNGLSDIQRHKLAHLGLTEYFDAIGISGELGVGKPDIRAFSHVMDKLQVSPRAAVMIGDSWERDIRGALGAGMAAIWISGGKAPPEEGAEVTVVGRVDEVPAYLERMQSAP